MMREKVILVDDRDRSIGRMEKMRAHQTGRLHRAFSVYLFNHQGQLLLQQRATVKYHSPNLWTNTCCGHPRSGETVMVAAKRRLMEEMGLRAPMVHAFALRYKCHVGNRLTEHEIDHVLIGACSRNPQPRPDEVTQWKYLSMPEVKMEMQQKPGNFTAWFRIVMPVVEDWMNV